MGARLMRAQESMKLLDPTDAHLARLADDIHDHLDRIAMIRKNLDNLFGWTVRLAVGDERCQ